MTDKPTCARGRCPNAPSCRKLCNKHYRQFRAEQARNGVTPYVPVDRAFAHVQELMAAGLRPKQIAALTGVCDLTITNLLRSKYPTIKHETEQRLLAFGVPTVLHHVATDHSDVNATGTVRRLRGLVAMGYSQRALARFIDTTETYLAALIAFKKPLVEAVTARKVERVYDQRAHVPPFHPNGRAKRRALALGWAPPLAWDEDTIDDPTAQPHTGGSAVPPTFVQRYQEYVELGYRDDQDIAQRMGVTLSSLERSLYRKGAQPQRLAS